MELPAFTGLIGLYVAGAIALLAPAMAGRHIFGGETDVDAFLRILGSVWLAIGVVAIAGLFDPIRYAPVLLLQLIYKSAWLGFVAFPALVSGTSSRALKLLTALFTVWVLALIVLLPVRSLLSGAL